MRPSGPFLSAFLSCRSLWIEPPGTSDFSQLLPAICVRVIMLRRRNALLSALLLSLSFSAVAQQPAPQSSPPAGWVPQSVESLAQHATFHTNFTFDRSMLRFASNFWDSGDEDARRAVNKLDAISVHSFHYAAPGMYNPALLESIRTEYEATGWKHMVTAHPKGDPFNTGETDLWISFAHMDVTGMVVLLAGERDVEVIAITGDLSPLDLLHLRGHFGIPRFDGDGLTAAPEAKKQPRPEYVEPSPAPPPPPSR
jgi:Domain of unknown function (DUF4252)